MGRSSWRGSGCHLGHCIPILTFETFAVSRGIDHPSAGFQLAELFNANYLFETNCSGSSRVVFCRRECLLKPVDCELFIVEPSVHCWQRIAMSVVHSGWSNMGYFSLVASCTHNIGVPVVSPSNCLLGYWWLAAYTTLRTTDGTGFSRDIGAGHPEFVTSLLALGFVPSHGREVLRFNVCGLRMPKSSLSTGVCGVPLSESSLLAPLASSMWQEAITHRYFDVKIVLTSRTDARCSTMWPACDPRIRPTIPHAFSKKDLCWGDRGGEDHERDQDDQES